MASHRLTYDEEPLVSDATAAVRAYALRRAAEVQPERLLQTVIELVRVPSHSGQEAPIVAWLSARLQALGMQVTVDRHMNVVGRLTRGPRRLLVIAHRNIREPDPAGGDPCEPRVVADEGDQLIYGLGVASSKASLAALLEALAAILGDPDAAHLPSVVVASHPGTFGERGGGTRELFDEHLLDADGALVLEPTGLQPGVAARGYAHVEASFEATSPALGQPITAVIALVQALQSLPLAEHPQLGAATATPIHWWSDRDPATGVERAGVLIDRRFLPDEPGLAALVETCRRQAEAVAGSLRFQTTLQRFQYPFVTPPEAPVLSALAAALRLCAGCEPEPRTLLFSCGAGTVQHVAGIAPVAFSANEVAYVGANEHVRLAPNVVAARTLAAMMTLFAATTD